MIDLYYWPTPNGHKITIALEEMALDYRIIPVNIGKGDQFKSDFLKISPNNRMPAIVDHEGLDGQETSVFESGAILLYLAEKTGQFLPNNARERIRVLEWLFWQMGGLGPMMGQLSHFTNYAHQVEDCDHSYAKKRYFKETERLFGVMDRQLETREFLAGDYSIADMASWPWVRAYEGFGVDIERFSNLKRWHMDMDARPAVQKALAKGKDLKQDMSKMDEEAKKALFGK